MARVVWLDFPEELRRIVEPYIERELRFLPPWVLELRVAWDADGGDAGMRASVHFEYRCGTITFCAGWFQGTEHYRRSAIRHEIVHFPLHVLKCLAIDLIHRQTDEAFRAHLTEQLRAAVEMATVDVEEMLTVALTLPRELEVSHIGHPDRRLTQERP